MTCSSCHRDVTITLVVTGRRGESALCVRCWLPQPEAVLLRAKGKR